ncbi:hypothetical protein [Bacteroides thetaiotaomicron]|jgi:hypothetical protein|uniref:hypothetical protein n=1 Tax=Bacteroides thetaiotaomicron TaxID=818 RepID=UPI002165EC9E|nr:hypothetical protein [Bacteroides thetaiotaomicron]MCS2601369.1 hypothetical protein [Bacteroides thetaiotaomicron]
MAKLNFENFTVPIGISGKNKRTGDARESFADMIYMNINGIRAHALAMKIYRSEGETEYSDDEVRLIKDVAYKLCAPNFIDGLRAQLEEGGINENSL